MILKPKSGKSTWLKVASGMSAALVSVTLFAAQIENNREFTDVITEVTAQQTEGVNFISDKKDDNKQSDKKRSSNHGAFITTEEQPSFPGGEVALLNFISQNMKYPEVACEKGIRGRVIVSFIIEKDGSIVEAAVVRGVDPELDKEAIRLVESFPKWKPGKKSGEPVRVKYTLPITFKLDKEKKGPEKESVE